MIEALPYYPVYLADLAQSLGRLSKPEGVCAWQLLWHEYHYCGGLPDNDDKVRRIAGLTGNKKWDRVRDELLSAGFTRDWCNPKWDKSIAAATAARNGRVKGGKARAEKAAEARGQFADCEAEVPF
jgi:uncharacterized protein YdaU (DUF1376 family)